MSTVPISCGCISRVRSVRVKLVSKYTLPDDIYLNIVFQVLIILECFCCLVSRISRSSLANIRVKHLLSVHNVDIFGLQLSTNGVHGAQTRLPLMLSSSQSSSGPHTFELIGIPWSHVPLRLDNHSWAVCVSFKELDLLQMIVHLQALSVELPMQQIEWLIHGCLGLKTPSCWLSSSLRIGSLKLTEIPLLLQTQVFSPRRK